MNDILMTLMKFIMLLAVMVIFLYGIIYLSNPTDLTCYQEEVVNVFKYVMIFICIIWIAWYIRNVS